MDTNSNTFRWFPEAASTFAGDVDALYIFMNVVTLIFTLGICIAIVGFAIKYRRRPGNMQPGRIPTSKALELTWTFIPFLIVVVMFFWGAQVFFHQKAIPENATEILVTGKKWMWKYQHSNGRREINDLHIPMGVPIKFKMASEDVIHCVYIPAFRTKQDVLPGRYTYLWFEATKAGTYDLFCNQYCGTDHSKMVGKVHVMEPAAYQNWLSGYTGETPEKSGEALFTKYACNTCHVSGSTARGPLLNGVYGSKVLLESGETVIATDDYIRESILHPQAQIVAGFQPLMPGYSGQLSQDQVNDLIAYIKTLKGPDGAAQAHAGQASGQVGSAVQSSASAMTQPGTAQASADETTTPTSVEASPATAPQPTPGPEPAELQSVNDTTETTGTAVISDEPTTMPQTQGVQ